MYRIGIKGSVILGQLLARNHLLQFVNLADNGLSQESLFYIVEGLKYNPELISLNLSQNDLGAGSLSYSPFGTLLGIFEPSRDNPEFISCKSLEEIVISSNQLTNKHIEDLAYWIKQSAKNKIKRIDLANNKLSVKGVLVLFQALRANL